MDDAQTAIYVAIRTSPRRLRVALASKNPIEGDEATLKMVERVFEALGNYNIVRIERDTPNFTAACGIQIRR